MEMTLTLSLQGAGWTLALLLCTVCAAVVWYYRHTTPPLQRRRKTLLGMLRGAAVVTVLVLLFQPLVTVSRTMLRKPHVTVLVDNTASMRVADRLGDRRAEVRALLDSEAFQRLQDRYDVSLWAFSTVVDSLAPGDTLGFSGEGTDIAQALADGAGRRQEESSDIRLLITDGVYTAGENPVRAVERTTIPVYTVGIGDSVAPRDAVLRNVQSNELAYLGSDVPVGVTIAANGLAGQRAVLSLHRGNQLLQQEILTLPEDGREIRKDLMFRTETPGQQTCRVSLSSVSGELTEGNNHREFSITVLERKRHITVIAGRPDAEIGFLQRSLKLEAETEVALFVLRGDGRVFTGETRDVPSALQRTDVLVLYDFPTPQTPGPALQAVQSAIAGRRLPVWYMAGRNLEPQKQAFLQSLAPCQVATLFNEERLVYPILLDHAHPAVRVRDMPDDNAECWNRLPPVFSMGWALKPAAAGQLWVGIEPVRSRLAVSPDQFPLLWGIQHEGRKIAVWNGYGFWRWHLMTRQDSQIDDVYAAAVGSTVGWLNRRDDEKTVRVETSRRLYQSGESIDITAQVYTEQYEPLDGADVRVTVRRGEHTVERMLNSDGDGRYSTRLDVLEPGDYELQCQAEFAGRALGDDSGSFRISDFSVELITTRQDRELLVRLAEMTGGRYSPVSQAQAMLDSLNLTATRHAIAADFQFHDRWPVLLLIVAGLSLEWLLRKRWGLL